MKILRTPDERFEKITDFPYKPHYTDIKTNDGSDLRIHHICLLYTSDAADE